jgi:hypothetical protein
MLSDGHLEIKTSPATATINYKAKFDNTDDTLTVAAVGSSGELAHHLFRECWVVGTGSEVDLCRAFGWEKQAAQFLVQLIATKQILDNLRGEHAAPIAAEPAPVSRM